MAIFGKREVVFREKNQAHYRLCKAALQEQGIKIMESGSLEDEMPLCSCGPKLDHRDYGPNGRIDRRVYYISVRPEDAQRVKTFLETLLQSGETAAKAGL